LSHLLLAALAEISVSPDFKGLPSNLQSGLQSLTNIAAGLLILLSGLAIVGSLIGLLASSLMQNSISAERSKTALMWSVGTPAALYMLFALSNTVTGFFSK
jgi:hypothetical protein